MIVKNVKVYREDQTFADGEIRILDGVFEKVFTTNGVYQPPELLEREWYQSVELSKYVAYFLDTLNHDLSVSTLLDSSGKIDALLRKKGLK